MFKNAVIALFACFTLAACASSQPRVVQATSDMPEIRLTAGMATQIEMPTATGRVQSVTVGNPSLVTAERNSDVVNLLAKGSPGETNLIIRAIDEDGKAKVYQYRILVLER
ncbi:MAG: pilus assembly protein N-terminal domain-containing protein [Rhodospirillaceae bacterium]